MTDVTQILAAIEQGDPHAAEQLLPLVYDELRKLAAARMAARSPAIPFNRPPWSTRRISGWLRVTEPRNWNGRGHFFAAAAEAMRRILVERGPRQKCSLKRGGDRQRSSLDHLEASSDRARMRSLALDEALTKLAANDPAGRGTGQAPLLRRTDVQEAAAILGFRRVTRVRTGLTPGPGFSGPGERRSGRAILQSLGHFIARCRRPHSLHCGRGRHRVPAMNERDRFSSPQSSRRIPPHVERSLRCVRV